MPGRPLLLPGVAAAVGLAAALTTGVLYPNLRSSAVSILIGALAIVCRAVLSVLWRGSTRFRVAATLTIAATLVGFGSLQTLTGVHLSWWLTIMGGIFLLLGLVPTFGDLRKTATTRSGDARKR